MVACVIVLIIAVMLLPRLGWLGWLVAVPLLVLAGSSLFVYLHII